VPAGNAFEQEVDFQPSFKQQLLRVYFNHAGFAYVGSIGLLTLLLLALPLIASITAGLSGFQLFLLALFSLFPASDIATGLVNRLNVFALPPRHLPRLELKDGVPQMLSTFVVVPTMFISEAGVKEQIEQMETRYLSQTKIRDRLYPGDEVRFALLSDWADADQETMPNDDRLLSIAATGVAALNTKYGNQRFFVFHRKTLVESRRRQMDGVGTQARQAARVQPFVAWATDTSFLPIDGQPAVAPPGVCYVITLDADTKLPMGVGIAIGGCGRPSVESAGVRFGQPVCRGWLRHSPATHNTDPAAQAGALIVSPDFCRGFRHRCLCQLGIRTLSGSFRTRHLQAVRACIT